ncbi:MAG: phosphate transporter permease PstA, partial [Cyanobacteriota bacterium]
MNRTPEFTDPYLDIPTMRSTIARSKLWDTGFTILGLLSMLIALLTLGALIFDLFSHGLPRLSWEFFTSFPNRKAESAGILSAWVGSALVMLVTASVAIPIGIGAGIYLEEYAPKNWFADLIEINVTN